MNRYASLIGWQARDSMSRVLGEITSIEQDDGKWFAVIDDDYQVDLSGCSEVHDLLRGLHYVQLAN